MRIVAGMLICLLLVGPSLVGCHYGWSGPEVSKDEMGTVIDGLPEVPGGDVPYEIPDYEPPKATSAAFPAPPETP